MPVVQLLSGKTVNVQLDSRDFESLRNDILGSGGLADQYLPSWTDRSEADLGVALSEAICFIGDNLAYYQERYANESYPLTCIQRRSIIEHCRWIGYELRPIQSASVDLTIQCNAGGIAPKGTPIQVDTSDGSLQARFELYEDFVPSSSGTYEGVLAVHGESKEDPAWSSDGSPRQTFSLLSAPMTLDPDGNPSLRVWVTESGPEELWSLVDNFLESGPIDKVYRIEVSEDDVTTVIFPDGVKGKIPEAGVSNIRTEYRVGGGILGNQVGPNKLTRFPPSLSFIDSVTNPYSPSGGREKESIEEAKVNGPASLVSMGRAVRHSDFQIQAKKVSGVLRAVAYRDALVPLIEHVVLASYGDNPVPSGTWNRWTQTGTGTLGTVGEHLKTVQVIPIILDIRPCRIIRVEVGLEVHLLSTTRRSDALVFIRELVSDYLSVNAQNMGVQCPMSGLVQVLENTQGIDYINLLRFQRIPKERRITLTDSDITFDMDYYGPETVQERWEVKFTSPTTFIVTGSNDGLQVNTGTVGMQYWTDSEEFSFTINSGIYPPHENERWEIVTGKYLGNIDPDFDELCLQTEDEIALSLVGGKA
jgi:hypothetical protein